MGAFRLQPRCNQLITATHSNRCFDWTNHSENFILNRRRQSATWAIDAPLDSNQCDNTVMCIVNTSRILRKIF